MFVEEKEKRSQSLNGCTLSMSHCGFVILLTNILVFLLSSTWLDYISPSCLDRSLMWPCDLLWSRCGSRCNTSLLYHSLFLKCAVHSVSSLHRHCKRQHSRWSSICQPASQSEDDKAQGTYSRHKIHMFDMLGSCDVGVVCSAANTSSYWLMNLPIQVIVFWCKCPKEKVVLNKSPLRTFPKNDNNAKAIWFKPSLCKAYFV